MKVKDLKLILNNFDEDKEMFVMYEQREDSGCGCCPDTWESVNRELEADDIYELNDAVMLEF